MRVLVFAAHPDDEVLGVGGTILRHADAGDTVRVVIAGTCRKGTDTEQEAVAETMGVEVERWWYLPGLHGAKANAERLVAEFVPDIVYTHHRGDINADHRALHDAVMVACRPYAAPTVQSIRTFYTPSSTEWGREAFRPNLYVNVTGQIERKLGIMSLYASELRPVPHPRSITMLEATASFWGSHVGYDYAEPFVVERDTW